MLQLLPPKKIRPFIRLILLCLSLYNISPGKAQARYSQEEVKAELIERFTRFIRWPEAAWPADPQSPFVIGIMGKSPIATYLKELGRKTMIKGRRLEVISIQNLNEILQCQVLFIPRSEKDRLIKILNLTQNRPIVTIGDTKGFSEKGVLINFFEQDRRIRFEINHAAVGVSGLSFSSRLLRLARVIDKRQN